MEREILFRGKKLKDGNWTYGYIFDDGAVDIKRIFVGDLVVTDSKGTTSDAYEVGIDFCEVDPATVGQYTGLTDRAGNRIFDGDIICANNEICREVYKFLVKFGMCGGTENVDFPVGYPCFFFEEISTIPMTKFLRKDPLYFMNAYECNVIGNIHDTHQKSEEST